MSFINDLRDLLPDTATWAPLTGRDQYGAPTYGAGTTYACRLVRAHKLIRNSAGDQVVSSAHVWLAGTPAVAPDDRVTLSDDTTPPILSVERFQDEDGASHTKVYFR